MAAARTSRPMAINWGKSWEVNLKEQEKNEEREWAAIQEKERLWGGKTDVLRAQRTGSTMNAPAVEKRKGPKRERLKESLASPEKKIDGGREPLED